MSIQKKEKCRYVGIRGKVYGPCIKYRKYLFYREYELNREILSGAAARTGSLDRKKERDYNKRDGRGFYKTKNTTRKQEFK